MRRRAFITLLGCAAALRPLESAAQSKIPVIGVLDGGDPAPLLTEFRRGLRDLGYIEGQNIEIEVRSAAGKPELLRSLADDLVARNVDLIVTRLTPAAQAAKAATQTIPIVMAPAGAPVETGLIASLARPGGNVTGVSLVTAEVSGKRLELIREMLPAARRLAVLVNATDPFAKPFLAETEHAAPMLGLEITPILVGDSQDLAAAFASVARMPADAALLQGSLPNKSAAEEALKQHLPLFGTNRPTVDAGALLSYAGQIEEAYSQAAVFVDKILKGTKPADLPVQESTKFELVINLKTAKTLGITVPQSLLARADEVIE